jgi:hypothetical protein
MARGLIYHTQVNAQGNASVLTGEGTIEAKLETIARDGITLHCDRLTLDTLIPNVKSVAPRSPQALKVSFGLAGFGRIDAGCQAFSVQRLSRETYALSVKFVSITPLATSVVDSYVNRQLLHKTEPSKEQAHGSSAINEALKHLRAA